MRVLAIFCFVLAGLSGLVAVTTLFEIAGPEGLSDSLGYKIGSFVTPLALLAAGCVFWSKREKR